MRHSYDQAVRSCVRPLPTASKMIHDAIGTTYNPKTKDALKNARDSNQPTAFYAGESEILILEPQEHIPLLYGGDSAQPPLAARFLDAETFEEKARYLQQNINRTPIENINLAIFVLDRLQGAALLKMDSLPEDIPALGVDDAMFRPMTVEDILATAEPHLS